MGVRVDGVTTENAGLPAQVSASLMLGTLHFSFSIPRGEVGAQGATGNPGADGGIGPTGATGLAGPPFTSFVIDTVTTLGPGQPATVSAVFDGASMRLSFGIPQGLPGSNGLDGQPGETGMPGPAGPAFTSFLVDGVTTLEPWQSATVTTVFDGTFVRFTFGIPRGFQGNKGNDGGPGPTGPQGAPGEVTLAQLNTAIANTSSNSNAVVQLATSYADPDAEELRLKVNELIAALRK